VARVPATLYSGDRVVCERCFVAESVPARMRGLLGRKSLPRGEGILLRPAASIHTWFMQFPIDAVFLDGEFEVVGIREALRPWRFAGRSRSKAVLELPAGEVHRRGVALGDRLVLAPAAG
jgi:uncharacterized protein